MDELQKSALISRNQCENIAENYGDNWESRLLRIIISKEIYVIMGAVSLLQKLLLSDMSKVLKGVLCVGGVLAMTCNYYCILIYTHNSIY